MTFASAVYSGPHFGKGPTVFDPEDLIKHKVKCLVLHGGEDISPGIYDQPPVHTRAMPVMSKRDRIEVALTKEAVRLGIPIIGICRGAQLLCALDGGKLWQHVHNHGGMHQLQVGDIIGMTNSAHHQMMIPSKDAEVLGVVPRALSPLKYGELDEPVKDDNPEPEIVHFPKLNALGVQGHPEWLDRDAFLNRIMKSLIKEKLNVETDW